MGRKPNNPTTTVTDNVTVENKKDSATEISIKDDEFVVIVNKILAGQKTVISKEVYTFDEQGKCKVSGKDAKIALKINGFTLEGSKESKKEEVISSIPDENNE